MGWQGGDEWLDLGQVLWEHGYGLLESFFDQFWGGFVFGFKR